VVTMTRGVRRIPRRLICRVCGNEFDHYAVGNKRAFCYTCAPTSDTRLCQMYGIGKPAYDALLIACKGVCLICLKPFTPNMPPYIDHDHQTNTVRGLLHARCNLNLGIIENFDYLKRVLQYANKSHWLAKEVHDD